TADEVRSLITACSNRAPTGIRNRALLVLLYRAGCRISEALRLGPKDLDRAAGTVTVLRGKGGTRRTIGLDPGAFAVVERSFDVRAKLGMSGLDTGACAVVERSFDVRAKLGISGRGPDHLHVEGKVSGLRLCARIDAAARAPRRD